MELAVWEAAQSQFVRHAPLDDRILLSRFFDQVRRLARLLDFYRDVRAEIGPEQNEAAPRTCENIAMHLAEVAEDVRLDGVVIVTDHGDATRSVSSAYDRGRNRRIARGIHSTGAGMQKFLIERHIAGVEKWGPDQLKAVARKSNSVLRDMGSQIQWIQSFVIPGKIVCIYLAADEQLIREHARQGGFPCNQITRIENGMDPTTGAT